MTQQVLAKPCPAADGRGWLLPAGLLAVLCLVGVPLFLAMAPSWDSTHYDLVARRVLRGGTMYRDTFDTNPPGIVWVHMAVRASLGWGFARLKAF